MGDRQIKVVSRNFCQSLWRSATVGYVLTGKAQDKSRWD